MLRAARCGWLVLLLAPIGCSRTEEYLEVFREQRANWKETADILETVKDEKSMADAKIALQECSKKFDAIVRKAGALPKPAPPEVEKRLAEDHASMERAVDRVRYQVKRVRELKGGEEFLKDFESGSQGLLSAVKR